MRKGFLAVVLAVALVFGALGLSGCAGTNPDEDYNYYESKYGLEGEIHVEPVTFFAVQKMCSEEGRWLLYVDNEDSGFAERLKEINDLAIAWDVEIYHFNPDLGGGYAADDAKAQVIDLTKDLSGSMAAGSHIEDMQKEMLIMLKLDTDTVPNHALFGIKGAKLTYSLPEGYYVKEVQEEGEYAYLGTHLHYFNAEGEDLTKKQLEIFDIKYPGRTYYHDYPWESWMSNIQELNMSRVYNNTVTMATSEDYAAAIRAIAQQKPSYQMFADEDGTYGPDCYVTSGIDTFNIYGDNRFHITGDFATATNDFTGEKQDVFRTVANYEQFAWLLDHHDGYFAVFFGGPWCPSTAAIAKITNDVAKEYGIDNIYFFDPRLDSGVVGDILATSAKWTQYEDGDVLTDVAYDENGEMLTKEENGVKYYAQLSVLHDEKIFDNLFSRNSDSSYMIKDVEFETEEEREEYEHFFYNGNFLYANFMDKYLPDYDSQWNDTFFWMDRTAANASDGTAWESSYSKLTVPGIMMFNGEGEDKAAEMISLAEAEYTWNDTQYEDNPAHIAWDEACRRVFETNPYAVKQAYTDGQAQEGADDDTGEGAAEGGAADGNSDGGTDDDIPEVC